MLNLNPSLPDPEVLTRFQEELTRAAALPGLAAAGPALWPRFAGYYERLVRLPRKARRALQRRWRRSLGGIALLCALGQAPALAATINVGGVCTLVDAITAANSDAPTGGCAAGSGADIAGSTHTLTAVNNGYDYYNNDPNGLPLVTSAITIAGNGSTSPVTLVRRQPGRRWRPGGQLHYDHRPARRAPTPGRRRDHGRRLRHRGFRAGDAAAGGCGRQSESTGPLHRITLQHPHRVQSRPSLGGSVYQPRRHLREPKRCPVERVGIDEGATADPVCLRRYQHPAG